MTNDEFRKQFAVMSAAFDLDRRNRVLEENIPVLDATAEREALEDQQEAIRDA